jgi:hypothetical protein
MAQRRGGQRGVANLVTSVGMLLFGALGLGVGCSAGDVDPEAVTSSAEAQTLCLCAKAPPCQHYACVNSTCVLEPLKDGSSCSDTAGDGTTFSGVCLVGLCCPGCVIKTKLGGYACASGGGGDSTQCGPTGEFCANCNVNSCLTGVCSRQTCLAVPEGGACTNTAGACHNGGCCQGCIDGNDQCTTGTALTACGDSAGAGKLIKCKDCTDAAACTAEACVQGACTYPAVPPGTSCTDGNICNGDESCSGTTCTAGKPLDCNDNEPCTKDSCGANGCIHDPLTGNDCSDGDPCTTGDKCGADGKCAPGTPIKCDDGQFCTDDACDAGICVHTSKVGACDDGNACTSNDQCSAGKCSGTSLSGVDCNDNNVCTIDSQPDCNSTTCAHTPAPVTVACITDKCHEAGHCTGTDHNCVAGPEIDCDDKNPCTNDACDPTSGCTHVNNPAADCSDGDPCTENDVCVNGACGGKPKKCLALDACHEPGTCDQASGTCTDLRAKDGKECPGGSCKAGSCILDPSVVMGAGGEGGADGVGGDGVGGDGTSGAGGDAAMVGGAGPTTPVGEAGQGQQPSGSGGNGTGDVTGTDEEPERPFVRNPGGCSFQVSEHTGGQRSLPLMALALVASVVLRRSRRGRAAA